MPSIRRHFQLRCQIPQPLLWFLLVPALLAAADNLEEEKLIGWSGEVYSQGGSSNLGDVKSRRWIETISWTPRAFIFHNFLTPEECAHMISLVSDRLERSLVIGEKGDLEDPIRTSYSASIGYAQDAVVEEIEQRIARWTHLPVENGEPFEVLRYINGQSYLHHWDWFDKEEMDGHGNRAATVLMYLSDVEPNAGGETSLPLAYPLDEELQSLEHMSECASKMGLSVVPEKGAALLFWDMSPGARSTDRHALHASCPTFKGTKWTCTKWIHDRSYRT